MGFTDKKVVCADCNNEFIFSATEQEFYSTKGFTNEPKRCPDCRQARKNARGGSSSGGRIRARLPAPDVQCNMRAVRQTDRGPFRTPTGQARLLQRLLQFD